MPLELQKHHVSLTEKRGVGPFSRLFGEGYYVEVKLYAEGPLGFSLHLDTWYDKDGFDDVEVDWEDDEEQWDWVVEYWQEWVGALSAHKRLEVAAWLAAHP